MRIQQKTLSAGPGGVHQPGSIREVDEKTGRYMISQGIAVEIKGGAPAVVREVAAVEPQQETATAPQAEPPRRRRRVESNDND